MVVILLVLTGTNRVTYRSYLTGLRGLGFCHPPKYPWPAEAIPRAPFGPIHAVRARRTERNGVLLGGRVVELCPVTAGTVAARYAPAGLSPAGCPR